jgi:hypothetical protein
VPLKNLLDRMSAITQFLSRSSGARLRKVSAELRDRFEALRWRLRDRFETLRWWLRDRFEALRWRLRTGRLGRSPGGIFALALLGIALILGFFAATAATGRSSGGADSDLAPAHIGGDVSADVVTETERHVIAMRRPGKRSVDTVERTRARRGPSAGKNRIRVHSPAAQPVEDRSWPDQEGDDYESDEGGDDYESE